MTHQNVLSRDTCLGLKPKSRKTGGCIPARQQTAPNSSTCESLLRLGIQTCPALVLVSSPDYLKGTRGCSNNNTGKLVKLASCPTIRKANEIPGFDSRWPPYLGATIPLTSRGIATFQILPRNSLIYTVSTSELWVPRSSGRRMVIATGHATDSKPKRDPMSIVDNGNPESLVA
jgi:hypothetical protein